MGSASGGDVSFNFPASLSCEKQHLNCFMYHILIYIYIHIYIDICSFPIQVDPKYITTSLLIGTP